MSEAGIWLCLRCRGRKWTAKTEQRPRPETGRGSKAGALLSPRLPAFSDIYNSRLPTHWPIPYSPPLSSYLFLSYISLLPVSLFFPSFDFFLLLVILLLLFFLSPCLFFPFFLHYTPLLRLLSNLIFAGLSSMLLSDIAPLIEPPSSLIWSNLCSIALTPSSGSPLFPLIAYRVPVPFPFSSYDRMVCARMCHTDVSCICQRMKPFPVISEKVFHISLIHTSYFPLSLYSTMRCRMDWTLRCTSK